MSVTGWRQLVAGLIGHRYRKASVADSESLARLLGEEALWLSQKATIEYLRLRAGAGWTTLHKDALFTDALERCRAEGFTAVLGDVAETALALLRHAGVAGETARCVVTAAATEALRAHRAALGTAAEDADLEARLARALLAAPRSAHVIARTGAARLFRALPLHTDLGAHDREAVENNVRFGLCAVYGRLERAIDPQRLVGPAGFEPATKPL